MNKEQILELAQEYLPETSRYQAEGFILAFAAALTEPLEKRIAILEEHEVQARLLNLRYSEAQRIHIAELEDEIAHWHNAVIKEIAAQSIVPKVPMTLMECDELAENYFAEDWAIEKCLTVIREVELYHGIGGKV